MPRRPSVWSVPTALWAYGTLRAAALAAPTWTGAGGVPLIAVVVLVLFVLVVRGSRTAWLALIAVDVVALVLVLTATREADGPLIIPLLATAAFVLLLAPPIGRHVTRGRRA